MEYKNPKMICKIHNSKFLLERSLLKEKYKPTAEEVRNTGLIGGGIM